MKLSKIKLAAMMTPIALFISMSARATCPPIVPCKTTAEASTIAGSNADTELIKFSQDITTSTNQVAQAIMDMANSNAASFGTAASQLIATNAEMAQIELNQELKKSKAMSDRAMAHNQHLTELAFRASTSVVSPDDTKEEFELILETLDDNQDKSMAEVILILTKTMDENEEDGKVLVQLPSSKGVCKSEDVTEDGKCSIAKRVYPGEKLSALFKQCSVNKRMLAETIATKESRVAAISISNKKMSQALENVTSSGAVAQRLDAQRDLSCTPGEYKAGLCGSDSTPGGYQEAIIIGGIIPGGDVSASNFSSPEASSGSGFVDDLSDQTKKEIVQQSLDRIPLQDDPNQRVVPMVHTYRNANQVKSALNFIDNIVADDLISGLSPNDRKKIKNSEYQSRFLAKVSAQGMVRLALSSSLAMRTGEKMKEMIVGGAFESTNKFSISAESPDNKESVLGASALDLLEDRINNQSASLQLASQNGGSENAGNDFIVNPSKKDTLSKLNDSVQLQNEMLMKRYLMAEQSLVLESISVSQLANSPEMSRLMMSLRSGN